MRRGWVGLVRGGGGGRGAGGVAALRGPGPAGAIEHSKFVVSSGASYAG